MLRRPREITVLTPGMAEFIEDTILFGTVPELEQIIDILSIDPDVPSGLIYDLEALRYYRLLYGRGGYLEEFDKKHSERVRQYEADFALEILGTTRLYSQTNRTQRA